jgi:hypothetical protein
VIRHEDGTKSKRGINRTTHNQRELDVQSQNTKMGVGRRRVRAAASTATPL